jgi:hypothetical protein
MSPSKVSFPDHILEPLSKFTSIVINEGFLDNPQEIPVNYKEHAKIHLWNITGEKLLSKFIAGDDNYLLNEDEVNKILVSTIVQTNIDSLMDDKLIDGIENENGEMIYWMTEKGKDIHKSMDKDC